MESSLLLFYGLLCDTYEGIVRPLRIEYPNAWYHVMNRGRRGEDIHINSNKTFCGQAADVLVSVHPKILDFRKIRGKIFHFVKNLR
jgi:hypothetical protein